MKKNNYLHKVLEFVEKISNIFCNLFNVRVLILPFSTLHSLKPTFRADGLITSHTVNFQEDPNFSASLNFVRTQVDHGLYHEYRIYIFMKLAEQASKMHNSVFVECGVGEGTMMLMAHHFLNNFSPTCYLVDTYEGPDLSQLSEHEMGGMEPEERRLQFLKSYERSTITDIQEKFSNKNNVNIVQGSVPSIFSEKSEIFSDLKVNFLHIDMNNAEPEYQALKFFYDKMTCPGIILLDDYSFQGLRQQKDKLDVACKELGIDEPISLPTGQGLILKVVERN